MEKSGRFLFDNNTKKYIYAEFALFSVTKLSKPKARALRCKSLHFHGHTFIDHSPKTISAPEFRHKVSGSSHTWKGSD